MFSVLQELAMKRNKKDLEWIVAVCWAICYSRNLFVYECKQQDFQLLVARAVAIVESMRRIKIPPPNGWYKVNVDAAIKTSDQKAGLGAVIRNSSGKIVAAAVQRVSS